MLKKVQIYMFMLILMGLTIPVFAANHYVDKNASGSNNGSSWSNAWESFSAISWSSISSGDVIYISGGNDSTVYNGTLNIGKSGVNGNRIVITKGIDPGHNGEVVIDGQNSRSNCIDEQGHDYITISNLKMKNWSDVGIDMDGASEALVSHCRFFHTQGIEVLKIRNSSNVIIEYCTSDQTPTPNSGSFGGNGDFLQAYNGSNYTFRYNHITLRNINADDHCDVFQMYDMVGDVYAYGNFYQHLDTKTNNAQGIYMTTSNITLYCYNNIAYFPYAKSAIGVNNTSSSYTGHIVAYGNTFYQGEGSVGNCIWLQYFAPGNIIKNNILVSMSNTAPIYFGTGSGTPSIDYNTLYAPNSNAIGGYNGSKTWSQWQSAGFDIHGKNADPKFTSINSKDFTLQETSPSVDAGLAAGSPFNVDIMGVSRPQGQNYDMGAYEFTTGNPNPDTTPPDVTSAEINSVNAVIITFSEALEQNSAQTAGNYGITNGITVSSAILSTDGKRVTLATSNHTVGQSYIVTVNNVKDLAGNVVNPNANTAGYSFFDDTTPPELVGASLSDSSSVIVMFSEEMDSISIGNKNNYSISNGITVNSVVVYSNNQKVMLNTSEHQIGSWYTLTVNNVKDRVGNLINPDKDQVEYHVIPKAKDPIIGADGRWDQNFSPGKAIDGNPDPMSNSRWGGAIILPDSITFDIGSVNKIDEVRFSFYRWNDGRNYTYLVLTSPDGAKWTEVVSNGSSAPIKWSIDNFTTVDARYIKLVVLSSNESQFAGLWEAEVYGPSKVTGLESGKEVPSDFSLEQNYPNPFNPTTTINFNVPTGQHVKIDIYNAIGELVTELVNKEYSAGSHSVEFNAANLPSGVYIYRMEAQSFTATHKMMLMK